MVCLVIVPTMMADVTTRIPVVQQALGPQVTIDPETGEFVVDKQSLVVHTVQRDESASYNVVYEDQEGKNTNFQRYRRKNKREKWTRELTDKFYEVGPTPPPPP